MCSLSVTNTDGMGKGIVDPHLSDPSGVVWFENTSDITTVRYQTGYYNPLGTSFPNCSMDQLKPRGSDTQNAGVPTFNEMSMIKTVVLSLMFVVSFIGNTATLVQMYKMRKRKSTINTLIMHLATADLVVTFCCNVTDAVWASTVQWYAGNVMCKMMKFLQVFGLYLSTYIIVIISLDRCLAILDPMSRNKAPQRVRIMVGVAWGLSALFSTPQAFIFRVMRGPFQEEFWQCVTYGFYTEKWQEQLYSCLSVLAMFIIPLATMVTAYTLIFCTIARKSRELQERDHPTTQMLRGQMRSQLFRKAKVKSLRMTALIVAAFIICWTPYYVLFVVFTFNEYQDIDHNMYMWIFFFGMANSMVNPLIYGAFHVCKKRRRRVLEVMSWRQPLDVKLSPPPPDGECIPSTSSGNTSSCGCKCYRETLTPYQTRLSKLNHHSHNSVPHFPNGMPVRLARHVVQSPCTSNTSRSDDCPNSSSPVKSSANLIPSSSTGSRHTVDVVVVNVCRCDSAHQ